MRQKVVVVLAATLSLSACGHHDQASGGLTSEESRQLNEAATMLDEAPNAVAAPDETGLDNEAGGDESDANGDIADQ